jgi:hypothetical protein
MKTRLLLLRVNALSVVEADLAVVVLVEASVLPVALVNLTDKAALTGLVFVPRRRKKDMARATGELKRMS